MKGTDSRLAFEAAALSLQFRDVLIDIGRAKYDHEKLALFGRIEKLLVNAVDRLRGARKDRTFQVRKSQSSETPWSVGRSSSGPVSGQAQAARTIHKEQNVEQPTE